jgi:hypothetical protein
MPYDRKHFFDTVRKDLFNGMNYLLETWERHFEQNNPNDGTMWLAYALATFYHETAYTMQPIEEYGKGAGKSYGQPVAPHNVAYYGRGHVQLTWDTNYKNGQQYLKDRYGVHANIYPEPHLMLHASTSALVSYDGMIHGWFTGVGLPKYLSKAKGIEDPINARRIVNGTDKASTIANYYWLFKKALKQIPAAAPMVEAELPGLPASAAMPEPS